MTKLKKPRERRDWRGSERTTRIRRWPTRDHRFAYHEAGHAVVAELEGRRVTKVLIVSGSKLARSVKCEYGGITWFEPRYGYTASDLTVNLAGEAAEREFKGRWPHTASGSDHEGVRCEAPTEAPRRLRRDWRRTVTGSAQHAFQLVRKFWPAVVAVANALLERRTLSGRHVRRIVAKAQKERNAAARKAGVT